MTAAKIPAEFKRQVTTAIAQYPKESKRSAALPLLHLWQEHFGFISDEGIKWIAETLELQPINILELVTFYPMLRQKRVGKTHIRVCRTLSCAMAGGCRLMDNLCASSGIARGHKGPHDPVLVSKDSSVSIEFVECLASCGTAPVCMINDDLHENVNPDSAPDLLRPQLSILNPQALSPHPLERRIVFKNIGRKDWTIDIDCYLRDGGYKQLKKAVTMSRVDILNEVKTWPCADEVAPAFPPG